MYFITCLRFFLYHCYQINAIKNSRISIEMLSNEIYLFFCVKHLIVNQGKILCNIPIDYQ